MSLSLHPREPRELDAGKRRPNLTHEFLAGFLEALLTRVNHREGVAIVEDLDAGLYLHANYVIDTDPPIQTSGFLNPRKVHEHWRLWGYVGDQHGQGYWARNSYMPNSMTKKTSIQM